MEFAQNMKYLLAVADTIFCDGSGNFPAPGSSVSFVNSFRDALSGIPFRVFQDSCLGQNVVDL